jgi:hypothetical protein
VRTAADGVECLSEVVGDGVGGGDRLLPGLDLDGAVAAGRLDELPDGPAGLRLDPAPTARAAKTTDRWASIESRLRWKIGLAWRSDFDMRKLFSISKSLW